MVQARRVHAGEDVVGGRLADRRATSLATPSPRMALGRRRGRAHREDHKIVEHPVVGSVTVDCDVMTEGDADRKIVVMTAGPDTEDETKVRLAVLSGTPDPARG
ncbi:hypothetical protein AB0H12_30490 [Actinosynnema sp. NPDC023794]